MNKGQVISTEFLFAILILLTLFVLGMYLWNLTSARINENLIKNNLVTNAIEISDNLLRSQGSPTDWEENVTNVASIGLGVISKSNKLDRDKILSLTNISYNQIKDSLGIKSFEFYFRISNLSGSTIQIDGKGVETGVKPNVTSDIVNARRIAILGNEFVYMDVIIWK